MSLAIICSTCDGYQLVDDGAGALASCPDCHTVVRCPVHGQLVPVRDGVLAGRCWRCMEEAAAALRGFERQSRSWLR